MDLGIQVPTESKKSRIGIAIGAAAGGSALVLLVLMAVYAFRRKRRAGRAIKHGISSGKTNMIDFYFLKHFFSFCR